MHARLLAIWCGVRRYRATHPRLSPAGDAFGVLPPVSKLTPAQTMYHFISGYTAKVAGTEMGVKEPEATFSACFGAPFLVWHPTVYASMLAERLRQHNAQAWLVNTVRGCDSFDVRDARTVLMPPCHACARAGAAARTAAAASA